MRPGGAPARVAGTLAAALLLAGCGHESPAALPDSPTPSASATGLASATASTPPTTGGIAGTPKSPIEWSVRGTGDPKRDAVLRAVQTYWSMVMRLTERPDPTDPQLAALAVDPQRSKLVALLTRIQQQGLSQRGPVRATASVLGLAGGRARARACLDDRFLRTYDRAGKVRPGSGGGLDLFVLDLGSVGGAWRVSNVDSPNATCKVP
jgi:hypothetical protein